ncbi:MAG: cardiolipin synthase [Ruminococcaceae bacterium]|nr:cardiolipin synthase [Oscillospiraceae bacterium]
MLHLLKEVYFVTFSDIVILGYCINILLVLILIFFERRDPIVSVTWVFCLVTMPVIGLVLFLTFGLGLKRHTRRQYLKKALQGNNIIRTLHAARAGILPSAEVFENSLQQYLSTTCHSTLTANNRVRIFTDAEEKYRCLFRDIEQATDTVNLLYFIIQSDELGEKLVELLCKKAKEGVEVRLMYDSFGSVLTKRKLFAPLKQMKNAYVAEFFPVHLLPLSKINHRNHRKIAVIDGKIAYLGGMNIGMEYAGKGKKMLPWRDTHMRITGEAVADIQKYFALDWEFSTRERITNRLSKFFPAETATEQGNVKMQIAASGPESPAEEIKCGMIRMIYGAKKYIYLQSPYFVPDQAFLTALRTAAESGVDVRVMLPGIPDKTYVYHTTMSYVGDLLNAGIKVYLYPGFIHAKTIVADDELATIGTTNIDIRSFVLHFELNAFLYDTDIAKECHEIFLADQKKSSQLTKEIYAKRGLLRVMKEGFFRLFSPLM